MHGTHTFTRIRNVATLAAWSIVLGGCLADEKADAEKAEIAINNNVTGSVGDGPVVGASMRILQNDARVLADFQSDTFADFDVTVRTEDRYYPLTIEARDGTDLVTNAAPDFTLFGVVAAASANSTANVNPFTTFVVEIARDLPGGLTAANVAAAENIAVSVFNSGLTSLVTGSPSTTRIDASNVAEIVKASEALSETVRRTRDLLQMFGFATSANQVIREMASDSIDDVVDGVGGPRINARTAAISTVVSVQVLLEAMSNEIHVNDVDATAAMTAAIATILGSTPNEGLAEQTVTAEMLATVRTGLAAAFAVSNSAKIAEIQQVVNGIQAGMDHMLIRTLLPADYRATLDDILLIVAGGDIGVINTVNNVVRNGGEEPAPNRAPTISGTPGNSIGGGSNYSFTPSASDADSDSLAFSITGMPDWANFDITTGHLSGTPSNDDTGSYANIQISVTDGQATADLPPFSIEVVFVNTNSAPVISGNPPLSVNANSAYSFTPTASDPDGDSLAFSITGKPSWANFNTTTGRLSGTPDNSDAGDYAGIRISVTDGQATASLAAFSISVSAVNRSPTISGNPPGQLNEGTAYSFTPTASDPDNDALSFSVEGLPSWANFNTSSGSISGTPGSGDVRTYSGITITVSDGSASANLGPFSITVNAISLGSVTLNWTPPTENDDGTALTDLAGYKIYWGTTPANYTNSVTIDRGLTTYVVEYLAPGTYEFVATSFNTAGVESVYSNPATKVVN